jgi:hypothetical protein
MQPSTPIVKNFSPNVGILKSTLQPLYRCNPHQYWVFSPAVQKYVALHVRFFRSRRHLAIFNIVNIVGPGKKDTTGNCMKE